MDEIEVTVVGAGVLGLAIAAILAQQGKQVLVLEAGTQFGAGVSSRNSEVIHAGIYYPEGSLKARFCVEGKERLYAFCKQYQVPFRRLGKLIVANESERGQLEGIFQRARANGVRDLQWLTRAELSEKEPALSSDVGLLSPSTGIVDCHAFMEALLGVAVNASAQLVCRTQVLAIQPRENGLEVITQNEDQSLYTFSTQHLVNAAGLGAQGLASKVEGIVGETIPQLYLCKGNYFCYRGRSPFAHLIYPLPEQATVGLGIHATLDLAGNLRFGPDTQYIDTIDYAVDVHHQPRFVEAIQQYFPALTSTRLEPGYSGIRPKIQGPGDPVKDFVIQSMTEHGVPGLINLFGIESPGLTASLAIAEHVKQQLFA